MYIIIVKAPFKSLCSSFYFFFWWSFGGKKFDEQKFLVHYTQKFHVLIDYLWFTCCIGRGQSPPVLGKKEK